MRWRPAPLVALVVIAPALARGQAVVEPAPELAPVVSRVDSLITRLMAEQGLPAVSIALVDGERIVWSRGYGLARPAEKMAATGDTIYRVGSVSKLFTDLALMQLVEAGKVDIDAPIARYLPDFLPRNPSGKPITLRMLMAHRSGLTRESPVGSYFDASSPSLDATIASLNSTDLVYEPGARTKYSNAGIAAVGQVVERLRGEPFAASLDRTVLGPLGLASTGFVARDEWKPRLAQGLMWTYDGRSFVAPDFLLGTAPAGNLHASVNDLGRFLIALFRGGKGPGGAVVKAETLKQMWTPAYPKGEATRSYGIGFSLSTFEGRRRVGHGGAVYGFATELAALPDERIGVAVVVTKDCANTTATRIADAALNGLLAHKAGRTPEPTETTKPVAADLALRLEGRYGEGQEAVTLDAAAGRLFLTPAKGGFRQELRARGDALVVDTPLGHGPSLAPASDGKSIGYDGKTLARQPARRPDPPPSRWQGLIGEYGWDHNTLYILERDGKLHALIEWFFLDPLEEVSPDLFKFPDRTGLYLGEVLRFTRDANGRATQVVAGNVTFPRRKIDGEDGATFRISPLRPVDDLRREALAAKPPAEPGTFREPDLVDLTTLDPSIKLDIRYATTNNFLSTPFYGSARAFLQRPAAEALLAAHRALEAEGFGLLIHDAYRPWHVTRMFWDATPESGRGFVADPSKGSKHNRGCAVDLTLYDRATGRTVEMVGGYDEFSARSSPDYPGGTSLQRWRRDLLRRAMEAQGFAVQEVEWWHFDYKDWPKYPILNLTFEQLTRPPG